MPKKKKTSNNGGGATVSLIREVLKDESQDLKNWALLSQFSYI